MKLSDEELMVMFAAGTTKAFDILYERYRDRIYGFAMTCLHSSHDAEDAVQDIFLRVARSAARYEPDNKFKAWIFMIAINRIRTIVSRESRQIEKMKQAKTLYFNLEQAKQSSEHISRQLIARDQLKQLLGTLPADMRAMLLLKELEGMNTRTIAEIMGVTQENVRVRIHRARKKLRNYLDMEVKGENQ